MLATCSSETSVATQQTTRLHIPEDDTLSNHRCENIKSNIEEKIEQKAAKYEWFSLAMDESTDGVTKLNILGARGSVLGVAVRAPESVWTFKFKY
jgi:hypothetical protein